MIKKHKSFSKTSLHHIAEYASLTHTVPLEDTNACSGLRKQQRAWKSDLY